MARRCRLAMVTCHSKFGPQVWASHTINIDGDYEHKPIGIFTGSRLRIFRKRSRRNVTGSQQLEPRRGGRDLSHSAA